ncbi:MAG: tetratricopeptide repeat protein [Gammaproteobacteria bacterium]|nr:tetratricopeptide repeat protein [Gammaproteobacteria bacterium]MCY4165644.1 tetratricopeptide repeat protein [Gammaproteobacteria bacterium]MCY4341418.1 tetratricopeptide repeat protein [Gammaproteobacteria bacterium]
MKTDVVSTRFGPVAAALFCLLLVMPAPSGWAQEEEQEEQRTRRTEALSERVHRRLSKAQEALEADDHATAESLLREIIELRNLSPYEQAQTNNFYGYVYIDQEDYQGAIPAFRRVIDAGGPDVIGPGLYNQTIRTLAQLYAQVENFSEAIVYGRQWLDSQANPPPRDYMLLAQAHFQLEQWRDALDYVSLAIEAAQAAGMEAEENWWRYMVAAHWELEEFPEALDITKIMVREWPKKQYWSQLQGLYSIVEDEPRQLAAYWCMYDQGLLDRSMELVNMANLFMLAEVPYKAAVILQDGLDSGEIEGTTQNYRILAQAWQLSREDRKAIGPMRKAAEGEEDAEMKGDLYVRLAESYNALSEYDECASAARQAIRDGQPKSEGRTYMLLGQCLFEQEKYDEAGDAFSRAARDSETRQAATRWQNYLRREVARLQDLDARLARFGS